MTNGGGRRVFEPRMGTNDVASGRGLRVFEPRMTRMDTDELSGVRRRWEAGAEGGPRIVSGASCGSCRESVFVAGWL